MLHRIIFAILSTFIVLSAQPSFAQESEHHSATAEIWEELQALRDDMDSFVVSSDIFGRWESKGQACERGEEIPIEFLAPSPYVK